MTKKEQVIADKTDWTENKFKNDRLQGYGKRCYSGHTKEAGWHPN